MLMMEDNMEQSGINKCGECTKCCELPDIPEIGKKAYEVCKHCTVGDSKGCNIYEERPDACRDFYCCYAQMEKVHVSLRPDNCKMLFEKVNDNIFFGMQDIDYEMTLTAKRQIQQFVKQGFSVVVNVNRVNKIVLAEGHTRGKVIKEFNERISK